MPRLTTVVALLTMATAAAAQPALVPLPAEVAWRDAAPFVVTETTPIVATGAEAQRIGAGLAALIGNTVDTTPQVVEAATDPAIALRIDADAGHGAEGYALEVAAGGVEIVASAPAGLFYGVQTLRQLMPVRVEYGAALFRSLAVPAVRIVDAPRFAWRGMMLDVARHFFDVPDVERVLDLMALHKLNRLHLHLSDDQGWRIEIPGRPDLTRVGGRTQVGGGPGGFYTTEDYAGLVTYAAERFITVVPEIDLPGHTNAALASIPEINCDGRARAPYTGTNVGFSAVCVGTPATDAFVADVVAALAAFPGDAIHLGGDEVEELSAAEFAAFVEGAQRVVEATGRTFVGWDDVAAADLTPGAVVQVWRPQVPAVARRIAQAVAEGARVVLSPSDRIYLDIKYDADTILGLTWPGLNGVRDAYDWDPATAVAGVPEAAVWGVEAPLWSETLATISDIEFLAFPRLAGVAEIGWTPQASRSWTGYRARLGAFGPRWAALGVSFYRSPEVDWAPDGVE
ncbi:beta-N-acetylhexosaminidase [Rubrivirga sp. IMCC43871]|uniref:beta-N-acetylhexosaminidase n=1 Tax=Rubrivirga sp. IMCC43871 TaxID=3391575 RepID=UPI00398FBEB2